MTRSFLIPSLLLFASVATTRPAHAAPAWVGSFSQFIQFNCSSTGNVNGIETWVGYVDDAAAPLKTGDSGYVHAVAKNVGQCNDGVTMEILLPAGATRDTSKSAYCIRESLGGGSAPISNCVPWGFAGPNGGVMITNGAVTLAPSWYLEIQIPVIYNAELVGAGGGYSHALGVKTMNLSGSALPSVPVTVGYRAKLESPTTTNVTPNSGTVGLNLISYYKAGQFSIEYGTSGAFGLSTNPAAVSSSYVSYAGSGATLTGLLPSTTYYWRGKYVTNSGTFFGTTQSFSTGYAPPVALTVATAGRGLGRVTSNPVGIDCGAYSANACTLTVGQGTMVTLIPTASLPMYYFTGWTGACTGTGICAVPMSAATSVTANFDFFDYRNATPLPDPRPRPRPF